MCFYTARSGKSYSVRCAFRKVIQGHRNWFQSKARMRFPISVMIYLSKNGVFTQPSLVWSPGVGCSPGIYRMKVVLKKLVPELFLGENHVTLRLLFSTQCHSWTRQNLAGTLSCKPAHCITRSVVVSMYSSCTAWLHWKDVRRLTSAALVLVSVPRNKCFSSFITVSINIYTTCYCSLENSVVVWITVA